jgi:hypothetical protein
MWPVPRARLAQALVALGIAIASGGDAFAYVRSTSPKSGKPFVWLVGCLSVKPDGRGSQDLSLDVIDQTLSKSVSNWTSRTDKCTNLRLAALPADVPLETVADGQPSVVFRDKVWARPGGMPHDPNAIGLTTVFHLSDPGQPDDATILDADIELNGVNWTFVTEPSTTPSRAGTFGVADLENTLTHELGHVQGLAHTCWDHLTDVPPLDNNGKPILDCNDPALPAYITNATMYPYSQTEGETSKRTLTQDDINGICQVYSSTAPLPACFLVTNGGCDASGSHALPRWALALTLAVVAALMLRRVRRA